MSKDPIRAFYEKAKRDIQETGQTIIAVADDPLYCYTIGNSRRGLADLIIVAHINPVHLQALLNDLADFQAERGSAFEVGELAKPADFLLPVRFSPCPENIEVTHCCQASQVEKGRNEIRTYLQVLLADPGGKFPDEVGYEWGCNQQILRRSN